MSKKLKIFIPNKMPKVKGQKKKMIQVKIRASYKKKLEDLSKKIKLDCSEICKRIITGYLEEVK